MMTAVLLGVFMRAAMFAAGSELQDPTLANVTAGMKKRFDSMENAVATFTQEVRFGFSNIRQEFSGTLTMKKPNKYRIESEHQTLVTDGQTVWAYSPVNKQVVIDRYKENRNTISPEQFLINLPETYYAAVLGTEKSDRQTVAVLKLVPKDDASFIRSVKLWVESASWMVRKIQIEDVNETVTTYSIRELTLNASVGDALFQFSPPQGTDVVDLR
jgi:outer membrane lipoprotein carrier protein